ncbi:MAG TPA: bifunctional adenosylcobinamide kinase/adenosylcobinamide-phosphate guanylyltransferase [Bryobacteraceae bacterium]|nr:bifunctional adenosylcobinamide kinase/adenosylcobinamide-phosphate guanylyltransferase [Bryobacteraceae bacterium]
MAVILVGGGARSGKSRYAVDLARKHGSRLVFLATAQAHDLEMEVRVAKHQAERGTDFSTIEEPLDISDELRKCQADAIVVDCLTLWLSNMMLTFGRDVSAETEKLLATARASTAALILVTNEVGCGIVPETTLGRDFRDRAGVLNQRVAAVADEVYWMVFGIPMRVK